MRPLVREALWLSLRRGLSPIGCVRDIYTMKFLFSLIVMGRADYFCGLAAKLKVFCCVSTVLISYSGFLPKHSW